MTVSQNTVDFVKQKEGFESTAYWDVNHWSYGYGSPAPGEGATITQSKAEQVLTGRLQAESDRITSRYPGRFNDNELDALTSFAYNLGSGAIDQVTDNGNRSNDVIGQKMLLYVNSGGVPLDGLVTRRQEEASIFGTSVNSSLTSSLYDSIGVNGGTQAAVVLPAYVSAATQVINSGAKLVSGALVFPETNATGYDDEKYYGEESALSLLANEGFVTLTDDKSDVVAGPTKKEYTPASNSVFEVPFNPRPNIFQQFSTMTYSVSLYLMGPGQYDKMMKSGRKDVNGLTVFMQSGGINSTSTTGNFGAKRSEHFSNDFYLDNIRFESLVSGTSTMSAHNTFKLNFTITEPVGITFFESLMAMVQSAYPDQNNYTSHPYLMVVRFYGYDEDGMPIYGHDLPELTESRSDIKSVGEKFIPFLFTGINFKLHADKIDYSCDAVCPQSQIGHDLAHATLFSNARIKGKTLSEVFGLKKGDGTMGLTELLNNWQVPLVANGTYEQTDTYTISFGGGIDPDFETIFEGGAKSLYLKSTDMVDVSSEKGEYALSFAGGQIMKTKRNMLHINAGTKIVKVIDTIMQTSSYITNQYLSDTDATTGELKNKNGKDLNAQDLIWYKIRTISTPNIAKWDKLRNDYAYDIEFVITPYQFTADSEYANKVRNNCFSIHKEYNYWFTGQNTEVLNFEQDFNFLYYGVTGKKHENKEQEAKRITFNINDTRKYMHQLATDGNKLNSQNANNEISSNITSELYSPADQATATIDIVGDPDFICQSELFYSPTATGNEDFLSSPFMPDGSVNYDTSEIYFTINYNTIVDYDLDTGLADTTAQNVGRNHSAGNTGVAKYSFVYRANIIVTQLDEGKFTQRLEGTIKMIPDACTFAMPDTNVARRENPSANATTTSVAGTMQSAFSKSFPSLSTDNTNTSEAVMRFPGNTAPLPDDDGSFNTYNALDSYYNPVRDTPSSTPTKKPVSEPPSEPNSYYSKATQVASNVYSNAQRFTGAVFAEVKNISDNLTNGDDS